MKKEKLLLAVLILIFGMTGCGENALEGDCECVVALENVPKELEMLDENVQEQFYISVVLENIYAQESVKVELNAENDFKEELKLQPGTYLINDCFASAAYLVPVEVEAKQEKIELTKDTPLTVDVAITNQEEVADWVWNGEASREILQADIFSRKVQFEGQMMDVSQIMDYVEFTSENQVRALEKATLHNTEKGVSIVVLNETESDADWKACKLMEVRFTKNNAIWAQGAHVGMSVKKAVHVQEGLYGKPDSMSGTVLMGSGYSNTLASWTDKSTGDKLTLEIIPDGDYISEIIYSMEVFE
ncbi:MAG: hypothetical protein IJ379_00820 [Lachnospiraceae bacterium]|nr:hypothetical protein [Lachnospiraceae bacterium]